MVGVVTQIKTQFNGLDKDQSGTISREQLEQILVDICPNFTARDLDRLLDAADQKKNGAVDYEEFIDFLACDTLASVAGARLPEGVESDSKTARLVEAITKLRDPRFGAKAWIVEIRDFIDPHLNPTGFKLCQDTALDQGVVEVLLRLTSKRDATNVSKADKDADAVRSLAWEVLARLTFGNEKAANSVAEATELVPAVMKTLETSIPPEKLSALQLVQALVAASGESVDSVVPKILPAVRMMFADASFPSLCEAAFDVMVSCSSRRASCVVSAMGWPLVASFVLENDSRPSWLGTSPLQKLLCGRLATNVMIVGAIHEDDVFARSSIVAHLAQGPFFSYVVESLDAAVARREWPLGSEAYHSEERCAELVSKLADMGHRRALADAIRPLTNAVEVSSEQASRSALRALSKLIGDVECLNRLLAMESWRKDTLEMLHKSGDEPEATDLLSYLDTVDLSFQRADALLKESNAFMVHAPSVIALADIFLQITSLDKDVTAAQVLEFAPTIPLGPSADLKAFLGKDRSLSFQAFVQRVYGTPTILGWWPSLMEDMAAFVDSSKDLANFPDLCSLMRTFEVASQGKSLLNATAILERALPLLQLSADDVVIEGELSALGGDELDFKSFVKWVHLVHTLMRDNAIEDAQ